MALTVEDGTGLANADSLVSLADVKAYAISRGKVLPAADADVEVLIRAANDYLRIYESKFKGRRSTNTQALSFPRDFITLFWRDPGTDLPTNVIPPQAIQAVCQLVLESLSFPLLPSSDGKVTVEENVGQIKSTYQIYSSLPIYPSVEAILLPLLTSPGILSTLRV